MRQTAVRFFFVILIAVLAAWSDSAWADSETVKIEKTSDEEALTVKSKESDSEEPILIPYSVTTGSRLPTFRVAFADVPANITYLPTNVTQKTHDQIYERYPQRFQDAVRDVEGAVFFDTVGNGWDETFSLRGFNTTSDMVVLVDGVRVNEVDASAVNFGLIPMHDLNAIQIDRGSASPIYGSNAFAGVLHITTGRPSPKPWSIFGGVEWSSFQGLRFHNGFSGTLQDKWTPMGGAFTYYFNAGRNLNDGFRDNGEARITSFDIKAGYQWPDERGRLYVGVKHIDNALSNPGSLPYEQFERDPDKTLNRFDGRSMENTIVQIGADKTFFDKHLMASVLASARYNRIKFMTTSITFGDAPFQPDTDLVDTKSRASDLIWQLSYQDDWTDWLYNLSTMGMELRDASNVSLEQDAFGGVIVPNSPAETDRVAEPWNVSLFWRETLKIHDKIIAHAGMRHDWHQLKTTNYISPGNSISQRWKNSTLSTGLTIRPVSWNDLFFNYSQGYRVPDISEIDPFSGTISQGLRPEESDSYEVGTRVRVKNKLQAKFSFFLIDMKDEIVFDSTSTGPLAPFGQNVNIGKSRRVGTETRLDANPIPELHMYGSHTWTRAYVRETDATESIVDGRSIGQIPEHRLTFGATARPLVRLGDPFEGLEVGMHGVYTGKQHPQSFESASQATLNATGKQGHIIDDYMVWDFILRYKWKGQQIYFKVNNIFDETYYSRAVSATVSSFFGSGLLAPGTYTFVNPGAPREFVLGAKWEF